MNDGLIVLIALLAGVIGAWLWLRWNGCPADEAPPEADDALRCLLAGWEDAGERAIESAEEMDHDDD